MFALNGIQGVPLVREVLVGTERSYRRALVLGTIIPAGAYLVFTLVVVGMTGTATSEEAITGLSSVLGDWISFIGALFGFLTSATIFLSVVSAFRASLQEDFKLRRRRDFLVLLLPPLALYLFGAQGFISVIGLVGGVAVSIDMILLLLVYARAKDGGNRIPEYTMRIPNIAIYLMMFLFALGAVYTLVS